MDLSIIILNYRQRNLVRQCLRGILLARPSCSSEVIVVDNDSGDGCLSMVAEFFPWVIRIASPTNRGFAAGTNLGVGAARGRYLMLLNPDIALFTGHVDALVRFLDQHPRVGLVGPRLVHPDGRCQASCRRFPQLFTPLYRRTLLGRLPLVRQRLGQFLMQDVDHALPRPVDWLIGACLVVRRQTLEAVGLFDEGFFLYFEDLDFCRRVWQAEWEVWYMPESAPVHYYHRQSAEHGLSGLLRSQAAWHHLRSAVRYYQKYRRQPLPRLSPSGRLQQSGVSWGASLGQSDPGTSENIDITP